MTDPSLDRNKKTSAVDGVAVRAKNIFVSTAEINECSQNTKTWLPLLMSNKHGNKFVLQRSESFSLALGSPQSITAPGSV